MTGTSAPRPGTHRTSRSTRTGSVTRCSTWRRSSRLIVGLVSFALGLLLRTGPSGPHGWAVVAAVTGLAALLVGLFSQMMSATTEERVIIVAGIIAGFVGLALGLAHGGFSS